MYSTGRLALIVVLGITMTLLHLTGCDTDDDRGLPINSDGDSDSDSDSDSDTDTDTDTDADGDDITVTSGVVGKYGAIQVKNGKIVDKNGQVVQLRGVSMFWSNWIEGSMYYNAGVVQTLAQTWKADVVRPAMGVGPEVNGYASATAGMKEANLTRVETIIDAAIQQNIYVMVDFHTHFADDYMNLAHEFFGHISKKYGRYPHVIYEIFNEPLLNGATSAGRTSPNNANGWTQVIKPYAEQVIATIRKNDPNNMIIVGTRDYSKRIDEVIGNQINDVNVAYAFHYYVALHDIVERGYAQTAIDAGIPVFVTEWGLDKRAYVNETLSQGVIPEAYNIWPDFIRDNKLSAIAWSVTHKNEASAALQATASQKSTGNWSASDLTGWGQWIQQFNAEAR